MPPQRLSENAQLQTFAKNTKLQFLPNPESLFSNLSRGIIIEIKSCCNNNSDAESTFNILIIWTQGKVISANLKNLPIIPIFHKIQHTTPLLEVGQ